MTFVLKGRRDNIRFPRNFMMYKIEFYVPETHLEKVKAAVFAAGAGRIGNYDCCAWQTAGSGQFRPCEGSNPFIGEKDRIETVLEYKVELVCDSKYISKVIDSLKKSHPYETPAYQYWEVELGGCPSHPSHPTGQVRRGKKGCNLK